MKYISNDCSQPPELKILDTLIVNLYTVLGTGKNWKLINDSESIPGIKFLRRELIESDNENDGQKSIVSYSFLVTQTTTQTLRFEYGNLWQKNFKPEKMCEIDVYVK